MKTEMICYKRKETKRMKNYTLCFSADVDINITAKSKEHAREQVAKLLGEIYDTHLDYVYLSELKYVTDDTSNEVDIYKDEKEENPELLNRIAILEKKKAKDIELEEKEEAELEAKRKELMDKISDFSTRIDQIIALGNKCIELGIEFPKTTYKTCKDYAFTAFVADYKHCVGFMCSKHNPNKIDYIGIRDDTDHGYPDLYVNANEVFGSLERDERIIPSIRILKNFVDRFDRFEKQFYEWIDSMEEE